MLQIPCHIVHSPDHPLPMLFPLTQPNLPIARDSASQQMMNDASPYQGQQAGMITFSPAQGQQAGMNTLSYPRPQGQQASMDTFSYPQSQVQQAGPNTFSPPQGQQVGVNAFSYPQGQQAAMQAAGFTYGAPVGIPNYPAGTPALPTHSASAGAGPSSAKKRKSRVPVSEGQTAEG
jgi:hypothetical protein